MHAFYAYLHVYSIMRYQLCSLFLTVTYTNIATIVSKLGCFILLLIHRVIIYDHQICYTMERNRQVVYN